ncbi:septum site-determining protein MinC [Halanaerobium sp. Z-7514]|uniref:Probable septum site-determining protein MinC n=1 Tax=Halanaerobium polyolivorans TaxID=2886943 RepID=A0AAW4WXX9_9FIRM|nr:septum site-determining protein MinC [Halanaerobium polyolivorans]MCC3144227.1 septum site-determining protein MinC [Halanaerobium polyolivorans]RQD72771.1 MAG: septum site-determining protein MinC [Halanaerobium sp. MSAO_Bac5]
MSSVFSFQAVSDGIVMNFRSGSTFGSIKEAVSLHASQASDFFNGVNLYLNLSGLELAFEQLQSLMEIVQNYNRVNKIYFTAKEIKSENKETVPKSEAVIINRTLRSGQMVKNQANVVIVGDVNPGAEVIAGGDIIVFGRLRGVVHAGAGGNEAAQVAALRLDPTQLRIASFIARSPDDNHSSDLDPERAFIKNDSIMVEKI